MLTFHPKVSPPIQLKHGRGTYIFKPPPKNRRRPGESGQKLILGPFWFNFVNNSDIFALRRRAKIFS